MKNKKKFSLIIFYASIFTLFVVKSYYFLDPDFGWHLKMGEILLSSGVPKTDPFSYTMPSFSFVDHEWLTNIFIYRAVLIINWSGLAVIAAGLGLIMLFLIKGKEEKSSSLFIFNLSLFLLAFGSVFPFFGIRPQVLSWFFLAFFMKLISTKEMLNKYFWLTPIIVLFWANLHASFALAIFCLGTVVLLRAVKNKFLDLKELVVLVLCFGATLVNPYGLRLWGEVWQQMSDSSLRFRIGEWQPSLLVPIFPYIFFISLGFLVYRFRRRFKLEELFLFCFFLLQSLLSLRHIPLFLVIAYPLYLRAFNYLEEFIIKIKFGRERLLKVSYLILVISAIFCSFQVALIFKDTKYFSENYYPSSAIQYLKSNLPTGEIFSNYGWGGYLIWKLPEKKVFIDGRMPSWRRKTDFGNESDNAMAEYLNILTKEGEFEKAVGKYNITTVLWSNPANLHQDFWEKLGENFKGIFTAKQKEKVFSFPDSLESLGWQEVYKDKTAVIFQKNTINP